MNKFPLKKVSLTWGLKFTNFETVISTHFQHLAEKFDFKMSTPSRFGNFRQCDTKATVTPADDGETMWNFSLCWWNSSPIWGKIFCLCHSAESSYSIIQGHFWVYWLVLMEKLFVGNRWLACNSCLSHLFLETSDEDSHAWKTFSPQVFQSLANQNARWV